MKLLESLAKMKPFLLVSRSVRYYGQSYTKVINTNVIKEELQVVSVAPFVIMLCALNKSLFPKREKYFNKSFDLGGHTGLGEVCELSYECGVREGVLGVGKSSRQERDECM